MCTFSCVASWRDFILFCVFPYVILSNLYSFVPVILTYPKAFLIFPCVNFPESQFVSYGKLLWWIYSRSSVRENIVILHLPVNLIYQTQLIVNWLFLLSKVQPQCLGMKTCHHQTDLGACGRNSHGVLSH